MILVTGGAGFIGSNLHAALIERGLETVVIDRLGQEGKWRNLQRHPPARLLPPDALDAFLAGRPKLAAIFHLGAISETAAVDGDLVWATNVELSLRLWRWCTAHGVRLIYASSAATYGDGSAGFDDDGSLQHLRRLRPLNLYGWSKHAFDLSVARLIETDRAATPPQWAGLKFFNVYGPNEYHKGPMTSVVKVKHDEIRRGEMLTLFRSDRPDLADGQQRRDFIWVGDVVAVLTWLLDTPAANGLFNVGTGIARSYADLARAVCDAAGVEPAIRFVDLPPGLRGSYQSFTEAKIDRLRQAGYARAFTTLEDGIGQYVGGHLTVPDRLYR